MSNRHLTPKIGSINVIPVEDRFYARKKYYYNSDGTIKYLCTNIDDNASEADTNWEIAKYIYSDGLIESWHGWLSGAVNSEAVINALAWSI